MSELLQKSREANQQLQKKIEQKKGNLRNSEEVVQNTIWDIQNLIIWGDTMKILKKAVLSFVLAGVLLANSHPAAGATSLPVNKVVTVQKPISGTFTGWADSHSFEAKTPRGYKVFQTYNHWYFTHLKEGQHYTFFNVTNRYGQNIIIKINK
ncbi:hypothetical protein NDK43_04535 [Neobacillus pocheonensis]|uniref:Uncharacterized protein n=1 Tax=Neobacillus pocheonensis TaxID=363869 RepID=A0ABT0W634_9BACI|nr:hypothetical protein [Neobacillus pocheonensis]